MLFQHCFANAEATLINLCRVNFHFQSNINVETTLMNVDDQRCLNVDSTLICLLGTTLAIGILISFEILKQAAFFLEQTTDRQIDFLF